MARAMLEKNVALKAFLKENPTAKFAEVSAALPDFTYTPQEVSAMRSKLGGGNKFQGMLNTIQSAKNLVAACGSTPAALDLITIVEKLGGPKTARELLTGVVPFVPDPETLEEAEVVSEETPSEDVGAF